jgi:hypothetical protein
VNVATICDCCKEPFDGKPYHDSVCEHPVCEECASNLHGAAPLLNKHGMVNIYTGPCPDNGPEGLKNP